MTERKHSMLEEHARRRERIRNAEARVPEDQIEHEGRTVKVRKNTGSTIGPRPSVQAEIARETSRFKTDLARMQKELNKKLEAVDDEYKSKSRGMRSGKPSEIQTESLKQQRTQSARLGQVIDKVQQEGEKTRKLTLRLHNEDRNAEGGNRSKERKEAEKLRKKEREEDLKHHKELLKALKEHGPGGKSSELMRKTRIRLKLAGRAARRGLGQLGDYARGGLERARGGLGRARSALTPNFISDPNRFRAVKVLGRRNARQAGALANKASSYVRDRFKPKGPAVPQVPGAPAAGGPSILGGLMDMIPWKGAGNVLGNAAKGIWSGGATGGAAGKVAGKVLAPLAAAGSVIGGVGDQLDGKKIENLGDIVPQGVLGKINPFEWAMNGGRYAGNKISDANDAVLSGITGKKTTVGASAYDAVDSIQSLWGGDDKTKRDAAEAEHQRVIAALPKKAKMMGTPDDAALTKRKQADAEFLAAKKKADTENVTQLSAAVAPIAESSRTFSEKIEQYTTTASNAASSVWSGIKRGAQKVAEGYEKDGLTGAAKALPGAAKAVGAGVSEAAAGVKYDLNKGTANELDLARGFQGKGTVKGLSENQTRALAGNTMATESGGVLGITNKYGYAGQYQMGADALSDNGMMDRSKLDAAKKASKAAGRDWYKDGDHKAFMEDNTNWTNKGGRDSFLKDKGMQDDLFTKYTNNNVSQGMKSGALTGTSTPEQIAAYAKAAHLKGAGGANDLMLRGKDSVDANGTSASKYAQQAAAAMSSTAAKLDAEQKADKMLAAATTKPSLGPTEGSREDKRSIREVGLDMKAAQIREQALAANIDAGVRKVGQVDQAASTPTASATVVPQPLVDRKLPTESESSARIVAAESRKEQAQRAATNPAQQAGQTGSSIPTLDEMPVMISDLGLVLLNIGHA